MARIRSSSDINDLVLAAQRRGDCAEQAERLLGRAAKTPPGPGHLRAEMLVAASELLLLADRADAAVDAARAAVEDGGDVQLDARAHLAVALDAAGDEAGASAALADLRRNSPIDPALHLFVGKHLGRAGRRSEALAWLTRGVAIAERHGFGGLHVGLLLVARRHERQVAGFPSDDWDDAADRIIDRCTEVLEEAGAVPSVDLVSA